MIIVGIGFVLGGIYIGGKEFKAQKKRKEIERARMIVYTDLNTKQVREDLFKENLIDSAILGGTVVGCTIFDMYKAVYNHEEVLNTLEERFPNALNDMTPLKWVEKVSSLSEEGIESYISNFKGRAAEEMAVELLQNRGFDAELVESLNYENDDIVVSIDGGEEFFSVKCGDSSYVEKFLEEGDSDGFIINTEAYADLENRGLIEFYEDEGLEIIDGGFSDTELTALGNEALAEVGEQVDVNDEIFGEISAIAIVLFGYKTIKNLEKYNEGKLSDRELAIDIGVDGLRVGAGGVFGYAGASIGAMIGTAILPGFGTIIGQGIGMIGGGFIGCSIFSKIKERFKWGDILDAIEHFGRKYSQDFTDNMKINIANEYLEKKKIESLLEKEIEIFEKYENQLDPYKADKVTIEGILANEYIMDLENSVLKIDEAVMKIHGEISRLCLNMSRKAKDSERYKAHFFGELLINNKVIMKNEEETEIDEGHRRSYREQVKTSPNYPYKFDKSSDDVFKIVLKELIRKIHVPSKSIKLKNYTIAYYFISIILIFSGVYIIFDEILMMK